MKIHSNTRRTLFNQFDNGDTYYLNKINRNSIPNMIDVGANIGMISLLARILHPEMNIFSFEPHPQTFKDLKENVDHMKIKTFNYALGNGETFYLTAQRKMDLCNKFSKEDEVIVASQQVQSYTIQEIFQKSKMKPEDTLLKIDCEGGEHFMVGDKESEDILKRTKIITMEAHNTEKFELKPFIDWFLHHFWATHSVIVDKHNTNIAMLTAIEHEYYWKVYKGG